MTELLPLSIGIGLAVSLLFSEIFGLAAGGMVVPGYVALCLTRPVEVALTLAAGVLTFTIVHSLSSVVIIYGKRRTVLMILVGYLIGAVFRAFVAQPAVHLGGVDFTIIGYIIPGLIANDMDRQRAIPTLSSLIVVSIVVRLILIILGYPNR